VFGRQMLFLSINIDQMQMNDLRLCKKQGSVVRLIVGRSPTRKVRPGRGKVDRSDYRRTTPRSLSNGAAGGMKSVRSGWNAACSRSLLVKSRAVTQSVRDTVAGQVPDPWDRSVITVMGRIASDFHDHGMTGLKPSSPVIIRLNSR
jgi:hypothetical protein